MVVDSCRDQRTHRQPALTHLDRIGVDPESSVRVVVATHWHRDHVRGLAEVVGRCVSAEFWTSAAITSRESLVLTGRVGRTELTPQSPLREMYELLERLRIRSEGLGARTVKTAGESSLLYRRVRGGRAVAEVQALSPHKAAVDLTRQRFSEASAAPRDVLVAPEVHPNHAAVVLRVRVGEATSILGSDLENGAPGGAWDAIESSQRTNDKATIFKVPHHGSETSHWPPVWTSLLTDGVVVATTPFRPERLPRLEMVEELVARCGRGYLAAPPRRPRQRETPRRTRALMRGATVRVEEAEGRSGHVCMRCPMSETGPESVVVDLHFPAVRLNSLLSRSDAFS